MKRFPVGLFVLLFLVLGSCTSNRPVSPQPSENNSSPGSNRGTSQATATIAPSPKKVEYPPPKIQFVNVAFEGQGSTYDLKATIRNHGPVDAHLTGSCSWKCPVFPETAGGSTFASGELLATGSERALFVWRMPSDWCAVPMEMNCSLDVRSWMEGKKGSQKTTVKWSGRVQIPR